MISKGWRTLSGVRIDDIAAWVREASKDGQEVKIGTDSLQAAKSTSFVTVVVIHTPGKGGRVAFKQSAVPRIKSLRERLWKETWESVQIATSLDEVVPGEIEIHIDASPEAKNKSNAYVQELTGLVMGQGFRYQIKPDSAVASHVADHAVRRFFGQVA